MNIKINQLQNTYKNIIRFKEYIKYSQRINMITMLLPGNTNLLSKMYKIILNFSLKGVGFNKKKALSFFLAIEYLTNQKCIATLSTKNVLEWKLRKGVLVGCKVTLRKNNLFDFLDILFVTLPRLEKFDGIVIKDTKIQPSNTFNMKLSELILFYPIELGLGINTEVKELDITFIFSSLTIEEKTFLLSMYKIPLL